jgi:hypothetical protein
VTDGIVSVVGNPSKKIAYGDLLGGKRFNIKIVAAGVGWDMKVAPDVLAKNPKDYKIVGKPIHRVDLPEKFTGEFVYSQDVSVPGMLHGRVVRPATSLSAPASIDESSIKNIPGVVKIVRDGTFVGVVAETEWAAIQAAQALKVTWTEPTLKMMSGPSEVFDYLKNTKSFKDTVVVNRGNPEAALSSAQKKYEATFYWPFQLHGMMGPPCAVADVQGDKATIWTGTQGPFRTRDSIAKMLNIPSKNVHLLYREGSGREAAAPLRTILVSCLLLGLLILGWLNWREVSTRPQVRELPAPTVLKQPANIVSRTFDPASPPSDMPPLSAGENAECVSDFSANANVGGQTRRTDATHGTLTITQINVTLQLNITIWVPTEVTQRVTDHEGGHRQISEYYYQNADKLAARIASSYMGRQVQVTGADLNAASMDALKQFGAEITEEYDRELNPEPTQLLYDSITDHSRNDVAVQDAVEHALKNVSLESPQPTGADQQQDPR